MRHLILAVLLAAAPAAAQTVPPAALLYDRAPWWMRDPVIASLGQVRTEIPANRARFGASFQAVARTVPDATREAADKVRDLAAALRGFGAETVRVESSFAIRPLYEQYKDKEGRLLDNARADQIDRYQVDATLQIEVRDARLAERVYAAVLAARPTSTQPVYFTLEPSNAERTSLYGLAVADAARRAKLSVDGAGNGVRLGRVKLIDPTGRACETDVLVAGAPRSGDDSNPVMFSDTAPPPPSPPASAPSPQMRLGGGAAQTLDVPLPLQPPLVELRAKACVVYSLATD